jgi:ABC-type transport system involved in multi-copper enzyme maturation permease subunit
VQAQASLNDLLIALVRAFALVPVVVVLFFAGEIHWADRAHRIDSIINATPVPRAILLLAQVLALSAILLLLALVTGATIPVLLLVSGRDPEMGAVLSVYVLPKAYDWLLLGVLALVMQTFSSSKFAGWGFFVLFLIATLGLIQAGVTDPVVHYGRYPGAPVPPSLSGEDGASAYRAAWGVVALLILAFALRTRTMLTAQSL